MDTAPFIATARAWLESIEAHDFADANGRALELQAATSMLAEHLPLAGEQFHLEGWREKKPAELLNGAIGLILAATAASMRDAAPVRGQVGLAIHCARSSGMDEQTAEHLAAIVGGESWQSGGGLYLVTVHRDDGSMVVFSGDAISEYDNEEAFDAGRASKVIMSSIPETDELYVIVDLNGSVYYLDDKMERGWRFEEDALHEARAWESRGEGRFTVVRQSDVPA